MFGFLGTRRGCLLAALLAWLVPAAQSWSSDAVRIKDLGKIQMGQDMQLTGVGLVMYGSHQAPGKSKFHGDDSSIFNKILERMKGWLNDLW